MTKLINRYIEIRTLKNAQKLVDHLRRYSMAECMASIDEYQVIQQARAQVLDEVDYVSA